MNDAMLTVTDLAVSTTQGGTRLVDGVSFAVRRGEALGLVGESGSGKSLTLRAILGLMPPGIERTAGQVVFDGVDLTRIPRREVRRIRGRRIGMVFQDPMTALNPVMTVGDQIAEGPMVHLGLSRRAAERRAVELMDEVGIPNARSRARSFPHEFSGGMRQRVMIAIALSCSPSLLLCDEPTTALDVSIQRQILEIIDSLRAAQDLAVLFVTHDLAVVAELCERVAVMYAGQVVETGATDTVFRRPGHAYTLGLLRSAPDLLTVRSELTPIPGLPPDLRTPQPACRFDPRCAFAEDVCRPPEPLRLRPIGTDRESLCARPDAVIESAEREPVITDA